MRKEKLEELKKYINELRSISKERIYGDSKFLDIERYSFLLNNGNRIFREKVLKNGNNGDACIILPVTSDNNVVLVVQPRVFTELTVGIEFPAGYIEVGESPIDAVRRELKEEVGYISSDILQVGEFYQDQGCMGAVNRMFLARNCIGGYKQNLDCDEFIRYFECDYSEVLELVNAGYIKDAGSMLTLERAKKYIKGGEFNR